MDKAEFVDVIDTAIQQGNLSQELGETVKQAWVAEFPQWCVYQIPVPEHRLYTPSHICIIGADDTYGGEAGFKGFQNKVEAENRGRAHKHFEYVVMEIPDKETLDRLKRYKKGY